MVIIDYETLEYLPYIDDVITSENRENVEQLVRDEVSTLVNDSSDLHPLVDQILPLSQANRLDPNSLLTQEIERYEREQEHENEEGSESVNIIKDGIDLSKYTEFITSENEDIDYDNLYTTLSYSIIQERNLLLLSQNEHQLRHLQHQHLKALSELKEDYSGNLHKKRQRIDEINVIRKKKQLVDFKPVNDYLQDRWKEGIKSAVDLGIEISRMEMDISR